MLFLGKEGRRSGKGKEDLRSFDINLFFTEQEDRENILRARESGKGVLTAPFRLIKSNRLGVILTFAVYKRDLPSNATPQERTQAANGYVSLMNLFQIILASYVLNHLNI